MIQFANGRTRSPTAADDRQRDAPIAARIGNLLERRRIEQWVGEHPLASIGAALFSGAALGWLIKRR
jgi:ElaB/YqjD/DUF883 family membrane-anchored ribosome-binding protein